MPVPVPVRELLWFLKIEERGSGAGRAGVEILLEGHLEVEMQHCILPRGEEGIEVAKILQGILLPVLVNDILSISPAYGLL